jgi:hypothetical protein
MMHATPAQERPAEGGTLMALFPLRQCSGKARRITPTGLFLNA